MLTKVLFYQIHQPSNIKALCLTSKTVSAVATRFLYRDLGFKIVCANKALAEICSALSKLSRCVYGLRCMRTFDLCGGS